MGIRKALMPADAREAMSASVMKLAQCNCRASNAPAVEEKVNSSTAVVPLKREIVIHSSRMSQPPRFTPRRNGILGSLVDVGVEEVVVELEVEVEVLECLVELDVPEGFFEEDLLVEVFSVLVTAASEVAFNLVEDAGVVFQVL